MSLHEQENEARIIRSWQRNADPWIAVLQARRIESRWITDQAIIDRILAHKPGSVLDIGCGEGWLLRELKQTGINAVGVDAVPRLVEAARGAGSADVHCLTYADLARGALPGRFDAVVCNFSLLGEQSVDALMAAMPSLLQPGGVLIIQTVHPVMVYGDAPYQDGWRTGSWAGLAPEVIADFADPPPWYFRTLSGWMRLMIQHGATIKSLSEPLHPVTGQPVSVLFVSGFDSNGTEKP